MSDKKVILITGASSGIGAATALRLQQKGHRVYGAARRMEKMASLEKAGIELIEMDVTSDTSRCAGIAHILNKESRIDVLVNNAGYGSFGALEDVPLSEAREQFEVNVFGLSRLIQLVLPQMRARKQGRIINISSVGGRIAQPHGAWYHATKFAVEGLSDCLRMELKQFGIDVVVIQPGAIKTEWNDIAREKLLAVSGNTAYGRLAKKHALLMQKADLTFGSEPEVIARTIEKAIQARHPRTRYAAGGGAKLGLFLRSLLSDSLFDKMLMSQLK